MCYNLKRLEVVFVCVFCKIANKEIPAEFVYEDERVVAFRDIAPQAPTHIIVITKEHFPCATDVPNGGTWASFMEAAVKIVKELELHKHGYRFVINTGEQGGQTVPHLHLHILAGRNLAWPPG